jgi:hypothetical protein
MTDINVVIAKKRIIKVSSNVSSGVIETTSPVTLKNIPTLSSANVGAKRMADLEDVDASHVANGDLIVYHTDTHKYVVEPLDLETGIIDSGEF